MKAWRWGACLVYSCTACLSALALSGPAVSGASGKGMEGLTLSTFKLRGSHGYELEAISFREGSAAPTAGVIAKRRDRRASYEMTSQGGLGIHADLGSLGRVEVHFHRRRRAAEQISKGCRIVIETGIFRGEFEFDGEGGYTHGAARTAPGEVVRLPDGFCLFDDLEGAARQNPFAITTLSARSRTANGSVELEVWGLTGGKRMSATATLHEKIGALKITRSAAANLPGRMLEIKPGKPPRKATLRLPPPFLGEAEFQDPVDGPPTWFGTLGVSLPGAPAVPLAGDGFATRLCAEKGLFESCRAKLPPAEVRPEPQL